MTIEVSTVPDPSDLGIAVKVDRSAYLTHLLDRRLPLPPDLTDLAGLRDRAVARLQELAIPSTRDEEWRFTDLAPLLQVNWQTVKEPAALSFTQIEAYILPEAVNSRLVFVDGIYAPDLSAVDDLPEGVMVCNLAIAQQVLPTLSNYLAKQQAAEAVFTDLNTASFTDGAVIWLPHNQVIESPIQLLFVSTGTAPTVSYPRCLVVAQASSHVTLVEEYVSLNTGSYFTNPVTEIWLDSNAHINHTRIQRDAVDACHIGKTAVSQARDSRYEFTAVSFGAQLSRHNLEIFQTGEHTETTLNCLTMIAAGQLADTHSLIAFTHPHGISNQINKCIVNDSARAVFNGKIMVPRLAQLTNATQMSRNLLLSPKARVDTKPQLEITANDVKCAHGATVSQLEDDQVFYLQSRGLSAADARKLLTYGFAVEIIDHIPIPTLRDQLATVVKNIN